MPRGSDQLVVEQHKMNMLEGLLVAYLLVAAIVVVRILGHATFSYDGSAGPSDRLRRASNALLAALLWPISTSQPVSVWANPDYYLVTRLSGWVAMRERIGLLLRPPPCGSVVRYVQGTARYGRETHVEFLFPASEVAQEIAEAARQNSDVSWAYGDEEAMQLWIGGRDDGRQDPTDVPERWSEILSYMAWNLIRQGIGTGRCNQCNCVTPAIELSLHPSDGGRLGADTVYCPNGHRLLLVGRGCMACIDLHLLTGVED
jgi:hypothetical protein